MKYYGKMIESDIKDIHIDGWMRDYLKTQAEGLTGNLDRCDDPYNCYGWHEFDLNCYDDDTPEGISMLQKTNGQIPKWWPYEQTGYYLDGMERCGQLLNDKKLLNKAKRCFDFTLSHPDEDGFLGPRFLKLRIPYQKWPFTVFMRSLLAHYSATKDESIPKAIKKHYIDTNLDYYLDRDVMNVEAMLLTYNILDDESLLEKAINSYEKYNEITDIDARDEILLSDKKPYVHGVTYNEYSKLGAMLFMYTGNKKYLDVSIAAYKKIDKYFMLASGLHCSNEFIRSNHYMQSHEACDITDYTWSLGYLLMATGDASYADKIEKCILNAGIGQATEDFRALQYLSCPNQVIVDKSSNHNYFFRGSNWMQFRPNHEVQCCPGNITRFFPNYCSRSWMKGTDNSVYSVFFGESIYNTKIGDNKISILEHTNYPFEDTVNYKIVSCDKPFDFYVRIPNWCKKPVILFNGKKLKINSIKGFAQIKNVTSSDSISLTLDSEIKVTKNKNYGIVIAKGPLVYSFGMYGKRITEKYENYPDDFPVYNIYPDKDWNYCLISENPKDYIFEKTNISGNPWDIRTTPLSIKAKAFKVDGWELKHYDEVMVDEPENLHTPPKRKKIKRDCTLTPLLPNKKLIENSKNNPIETIELVPLATAKLRITIFPYINK